MSKNWEKYDPALGEVKDGNCQKRAYCLIFNKLYSEIRHLTYDEIVSALEQGDANYDYAGKPISEFNLPGLWVVETLNHVTVVKDGVMYDAESRYLKEIIDVVYEFPNCEFTDYSSYNISPYAKYQVGGIQIDEPNKDSIRIPLRPIEISKEETLNLIDKAFQVVELPKVSVKNINKFLLPNIDQVLVIKNDIDETAIWVKQPAGTYIYKKDMDELTNKGIGSLLPIVICKQSFGKKVLIQVLDDFIEAKLLPNSSRTYILIKSINATSRAWLIKNNIDELNDSLK